MRFLIRNARVQDAKLLCEGEKFWAGCPGHLVSLAEELKPESFAHKIEDLNKNPKGLYVVIESQDGKIMGHALLDPIGLARLSHTVRLTIVVHPGFEGQGIGGLLMEHIVLWAKQTEGVEKLELLVRATNVPAIALYKKFGFVEEGRLKNRIRISEGTYIDDLTMALQVK